MILSYKHRLYPSKAQAVALDDMLGHLCGLYNAALQQRTEAYQRRGLTLRYAQQASELKAVRAAEPALAAYSFTTEQQVLRRLDKAFSAFFARLKRGAKAGFPRFQARGRFHSAECRVGDGLTIRKSGRLGLVGIPGEIKVKWHRALPVGAKLGAAVISRSVGQWHVCFQVTLPDAPAIERQSAAVGVDLGLTNLVALSTGERRPTLQYTRQAAAKLRRLQRAVARKSNKHSRRRAQARRRLARLQAHIANKRRDASHKLSRDLVNRFTHIALENLNVVGLARGMLAKAVHNAAWTQLVQHLTYKAANAGSVLVLVDPRGTSQTCPDCGAIKRKALSQRRHICNCGCDLDRDVAAARIVLARAPFGPGHGPQAQSQQVAA